MQPMLYMYRYIHVHPLRWDYQGTYTPYNGIEYVQGLYHGAK